jgi:hypothetical protein
MTIERPMFPPRAESVDSFSHQPAIGQPESQNLTGDSPSPAKSVVPFPRKVKARPAKRKSAIEGVKSSGYALVSNRRRPKEKGKPLSDKQMGNLAFEAWEKHPDDMEAISGDGWHNWGVDVRFAHAVMLMSKEKLVDLHRDVDQDHVDALLANILGTHEFLKYIAAMMESAVHRIVISGCAALDQGILGDGKQPLNLEGFHRRPKLVVRRPA